MGLDIGIMSVQILERPRELAYRFAWELAHEASVYGTMSGDGNSLGFLINQKSGVSLVSLLNRGHFPRSKLQKCGIGWSRCLGTGMT